MKIAVVCFNLGGPDSPQAIEPFLFNLFYDPAIIRLPKPLRYFLAKIISSKRAPKTQEIYKYIGNKSPLLELTKKQSEALETQLNADGNNTYKTFVSMRYWHPFANQTALEVKEFAPDKIILLPLYPQFSTTTSGSSFNEWTNEVQKIGLDVPTVAVGCYMTEPAFIEAHVELLLENILQLPKDIPSRILFSAHGLPEKIIEAGDPYQWQVEQTVANVVSKLQEKMALQGLGESLDYVICYQSRVGRLKWIGPSTEAEISRAAFDKKAIILTPIAFVSEHSETLVELDIEYKHFAEAAGVTHYLRVPALGTHEKFITSLSNLCHRVETSEDGVITNHEKKRICPKKFKECVCFG